MTPRYDPMPSGPSLPPKEALNWRAFGLAMLAHGVLVLFLVVGLNWKNEAQGPLQVELWMDGTTPVNPPPSKSEPKPEPKPEPAPEPKPEPPPPPPPPPSVAKAAPEPKPVIDPDIALEEERKRRAELERAQLEKEAAEKKAKEDAAKEQQRIKHERENAEKQERDRLDQERKNAERLEREQQEKQEKEDAAKKAEVLKKQETAKIAAEEKKKKEADAKKAKETADKKAKEEADKKAKADADKKAAADKALKDAFRSDALGVAGIPGGTADRNQAGGGRNDGYGAKVKACVQPGVRFSPPPREKTNPTAQFRVDLRPDGTVSNVKLTRTSGNSIFDRDVENGIRRCSPFPTPPTGKYPGYIDVIYNMYD
jgi:colicin import membrane protein